VGNPNLTPTSINEDDALWTRLVLDETDDFVRRYRATACPVEGDDDVDDDDDDVPEAHAPPAADPAKRPPAPERDGTADGGDGPQRRGRP